jgi:ankyrin repeat protein
MQALYAGDVERALDLLPPDDELTVFDAAAFGRIERLRVILEEDPAHSAAFSADGFTPLHLAVFGGQKDAARLLIERGADVDGRSRGAIARVPPLATAAFVRSVALAQVLLDAGADVNGAGEGGFTALHTAAANGDDELVCLLLERGADPTIANAEGKRPADLAPEGPLRRLLVAHGVRGTGPRSTRAEPSGSRRGRQRREQVADANVLGQEPDEP